MSPSAAAAAAASAASRDSIDPIAELLSQLSGVRRSAPSSSSSQLQQLQMQLERQQAQAQRLEQRQQQQQGSSSRVATRPGFTASMAQPVSSGSSTLSHNAVSGGAETITQGITTLEVFPSWRVVKVDVRNAFHSLSRNTILKN